MDIAVLLIAVLLAVGAAVGGYLFATRRAEADLAARDADRAATTDGVQFAVEAAVQHAVAQVRDQATAERDAAVAAALEQTAILQREQFGALALAAREQTNSDLSAKKDVIDARLDQVHAEMRTELTKLSEMVSTLGRSSAENFGQVTSSLQAHAEIANTLADSTRALREALANPQARGNWGERMAEDVLRLAGFQENLNYVKQTQIEGGTGRPDYTFPMPKGHALYMDVKFPMASYLRYLEVDTNAEREVHLKRFLQDVRLRVKELAKRDYSGESDQPSVDYVLLFIPNEQLTGFIHEHDAALARRGDGPEGGAVLAAHPVRVPRRDPPGIRQLHDRADERRDPAVARNVLGPVAQVQRPGRLGEEEVRPGRPGIRTAHRPPSAPARTAVAPARRTTPAAQSPRRRGTLRVHRSR